MLSFIYSFILSALLIQTAPNREFKSNQFKQFRKDFTQKESLTSEIDFSTLQGFEFKM